MKVQTIICAAVLGTLGAVSVASAQGHDRDDQRRAEEQHRGDVHAPAAHRNDDRRAMGNRAESEREREYSAHNWHRGDRLPAQYRDRQYVIENWREHRLSAPPRGYEWVQVGPDYVLVAVRTGVIAQLTIAQ